MLKVEEREIIRRAYYVEDKSIRAIARETGYARQTIRRALETAEAKPKKRKREAPKIGPYQERIDKLLLKNQELPRKQRYTCGKIFKLIQAEGYSGADSTLRHYIAAKRKELKRPRVYLPLEFDPGQDAQVDWGEAQVIMQGEQIKIQLFVMRLNYSRKQFVMAFPKQTQECFLSGHVHAFRYFSGVPHRLTYDNLKTAVKRVLTGRQREEQEAFIVFRSHYLFDSHFCTPGAGHEKGGVESGIGYARRQFLVPLPEVESFDELNSYLVHECRRDEQRTVRGQSLTIAEAWQMEHPHLRPLPEYDYDYGRQITAKLTPYSQVIVDTNRYSVPADMAYATMLVKVYPFRVEIYQPQGTQPVAIHDRCHGRETDIFDPLHYLPLLKQRTGAFDHAKPLRQWRETWPAVYESLLAHLQEKWPDGQGIREFVQILELHHHHEPQVVEQAITQALTFHCAHLDGVTLCLHQLANPEPEHPILDLSHKPHLLHVGSQPADLARYDQLLEVG